MVGRDALYSDLYVRLSGLMYLHNRMPVMSHAWECQQMPLIRISYPSGRKYTPCSAGTLSVCNDFARW